MILYKSTPNPALNEGAYWNRYPGTVNTATIGNMPPGIMHYRICEFNLTTNACIQFSKDIALDIQ